jgi:cysteine synthase A
LFEGIIGGTPLIQLSPKIYAKLETYNPSGSVKDRMVFHIVEQALKSGEITPKSRFIEATSGNTGIALAMLGASMGREVHIIMPCNMSIERVQMMEVYGAVIHKVGPNDFKGAIKKRNTMMSESSDWWSPMQFSNPRNTEAHYSTTAPEIYREVFHMKHGWSAFVTGAGTGGTMMGVSQFIEDNRLATKTVLMVPAESAADHGIQGVNDGADFLLDRSRMDFVVKVETERAVARCSGLAKESGLLVGISSGANLLAAERWVEDNDPEGIVVTMLCDRGERYLNVLIGPPIGTT